MSKLSDSLILHVITRDRRFFRGGLSRRMDNRRRKEFFTPLFLTPGALWRRKSAERKTRRVWPRAGHGWVILISGLHTPLGRLDDYFGSGAGQYLDNTLTSGFVRSVSTTTPHRVTLFILFRFPTPRARSRSNISECFQRLISTVAAVHFDVTNVRANHISQISLIFCLIRWKRIQVIIFLINLWNIYKLV